MLLVYEFIGFNANSKGGYSSKNLYTCQFFFEPLNNSRILLTIVKITNIILSSFYFLCVPNFFML